MRTCLLSQDGTAWANLYPGELLPVLCPIGLGRNTMPQNDWGLFFFSCVCVCVCSAHVLCSSFISAQALPLASASVCIFDVNVWFSLWYYKWPIWFLPALLKFIHYALSHPRKPRQNTQTMVWLLKNKYVWQKKTLSCFIKYCPAKSLMVELHDGWI